MKKLCIILSGICLTLTANAQVDNFINNRNFDWSKWETNKPGFEKENYIEGLREQLSLQNAGLSDDNFHLIDINGDQIADLIFTDDKDSGPQTVFYLRNGSGFETVLSLNEEVINIGRNKPWNPINFQTALNYGQDAKIIRSYTFSFSDGLLSFNLQNAMLVDDKLLLINENLPPFTFELVSDTELRLSPGIMDSNIISSFGKHERGFAIASASDQSDQTWWLVMIKVDNNVYRVGWMLRQNLRSLIGENIAAN